jgi:hypothetical protein
MAKLPTSAEILAAIEKVKQLPVDVREELEYLLDEGIVANVDEIVQDETNDILLLLRQVLEVTELRREQLGEDLS